MRSTLSRTFRALEHRNFRLFFIGQGLSLIGTWLQQVAMGWLTYRLSGSVLLLGVVAFCANLGIVLFCTFAGVVADHIRRRPALRVTQSLAGGLLGLVSEAVCFALNALSFVAVIVVIGRMRWKQEPPPPAWQGGFWTSWVEGYRFVAGFAPARAMLFLVGVLAWTVSPYS